MSYFNKIFGIYSEKNYFFIYFLGLKLKFKKKRDDIEVLLKKQKQDIENLMQRQKEDIKRFIEIQEKNKKEKIIEKLDSLINFENDLNRIIQENISTANIHQKTFPPYKNIHSGKTLILVATGPSAKYYKPIKNAIHIGVNRAYQLKDIDFKYYFVQDYLAVKEYIEDIINYQHETCEKFFGIN